MLPMPSGPMGASPQMDPNPTPGANPSSLLGAGSSVQAVPQEINQAGPSPEEAQSAFLMECKDITMRITALARAFPAGAQDWEFAIQSIINGMTKSVTAMSSTEPASAPNLVG